MEGIRDGDHGSLAFLVQRYWGLLLSYASGFTGREVDEAEDIVQETFVRVWRQRAAWTPSGSVGAYLYRITRNLALNARRDRKALEVREERGAEEISIFPSNNPAADLEGASLREQVELAVAGFPERRREVFVLCRFHGLTHQEIAETLGMSRQTVANHMSAALADLRTSISQHLRG